ncbi:MAG TPA: protein kinase [Candidatus Angelobacter sp.]|nr:protein kinase [Candidatus Angelobacter sp.]
MSLAKKALLIPAEERTTFLQAACPQGSDLFDEVSEIVEWEDRMGDFMRDPLIELIDLEGLDRPFSAGQLIADRFEIRREVGDGGMGVVYEAFDRERKERIAIKCAKLGYERLAPELNGALKVRHSNVCQVNDIHKISNDLGEFRFITMEFLEGETLQGRLAQGAMQSPEALKFARQLCSGLAEAHRSGVIHGDLKPANIILTPEKDSSENNQELRAVITDFGLAVDEDGNTDLLGGTPAYMAPELKENGRNSTASDVYALGVILYEMVTGQKPFPKAEASKNAVPAAEAAIQLVRESPVPPGKLVKHLPPVWDKAILPCLAPLPEKRPSVEQVLAVLRRKPFYRRPEFLMSAAAALLFLTIAMAAWPTIKTFFWPDIRLAVLPVQAPPDLVKQGTGIAKDLAERLKQLQKPGATMSVIPPSDTAQEEVTTPEQAGRILHVTHALQLKLSHQGTDIVVEQSLVELAQLTQVSSSSAAYSPQAAGDIPGALTGAVSSALHLAHARGADDISPAATVTYDRGLADLAGGTYSYDNAIQSFQEAATLDLHSALPWAGLADAQMQKFEATGNDQWQKAAHDSLQKAESLNPDSVRVLLAAGYRSLKEGKYPDAMDRYNRVLEIDPHNIEALQYKGFTLDGENKPEAAIQNFRLAIAQDDKFYSSYETFGSYYFNRGLYPAAEAQFRKGIEIAPGRPDALANLGAVLVDDCKYEDAITELKKVPEDKRTPQVWNNLGAAYAALGKDDLAVSFYRKAIEKYPGYVRYQLNLGDSERRLGNLAAATAAYEEGLRLVNAQLKLNQQQPQELALRANLGARLGKTDEAIHDIQSAIYSWPKDSQVIRYTFLAYVAMDKGDSAAAFEALKQSTPNLAKELACHPDLAEFRKNLRFREWMDNKLKGV